MDKTQTFVAVLSGAERLGNTANGNPRYRLHMEGAGWSDTKPDSAVGNEVDNHLSGPHSWVGKRVEFTATMAGTVIGWKLAE